VTRSDRKQTLIDRAVRFLRFGVVGGSGVVVNQSVLIGLHGLAGWPLLPSSLVAIECAILSNFTLSSLWIWRYDYEGSRGRVLQKFLQYQAATLFSSLGVNASVLAMLVYWFDIDYRWANLGGIASGMALNFMAGELWVFRPPDRGQGDGPSGSP
jgi:putative flippase GtrA